MVNEHVAAADGGEERGAVAHDGGDGRDERGVAQFRRVVAFVNGHEPRGVDGTVHDVEIVLGEAEIIEQHLPDGLRAVGVHFETNGLSTAAVSQFLLDGLQEIFRVVLVHVKLAVSRDTKFPVPEDFRAGEKVGEIVADDVAEKEEVHRIIFARQSHETRQHTRHLHDGEARAVGAVLFEIEADDDVQRLVLNVWKWMRRVHRERCEDGADLMLIVLFQPGAVALVEFSEFAEADSRLVQRGAQFTAPQPVLILHHATHPFAHCTHSLRGRAPIETALDDVALDLLLQARESHLEKLIEIRTDDAEKLHPFEQRRAGIQRLLEDALIEFQPAHLAAEKVFSCEVAHGFQYATHAPTLAGVMALALTNAAITRARLGGVAVTLWSQFRGENARGLRKTEDAW